MEASVVNSHEVVKSSFKASAGCFTNMQVNKIVRIKIKIKNGIFRDSF